MSLTDLDRFKAACVYPGKLDEQAVERELRAYLQALDENRQIVRLRAGWRFDDYPPLKRNVQWIAEKWIKSDPAAKDVLSGLEVCAARALPAVHDAPLTSDSYVGFDTR